MSESDLRSSPLQAREIALLAVAMVLVSMVSFGFGYLTGRDRGAAHDVELARGIDADLADPSLVELLAQIEVADAPDKGRSELTYPNDLRGRPQLRPPQGGYTIDLGVVPEARLGDLQTVLEGRGVPTNLVEEAGGTRLFVGAFADAEQAAFWLSLVEDLVDGLGLDPHVVRTTPADD